MEKLNDERKLLDIFLCLGIQTRRDGIQILETINKSKVESNTPRHNWKSLDGQKIESTSSFHPLRGIVLEE